MAHSEQSDIRNTTNLAVYNKHEEILELFLLGKWLKTGNLSKNISQPAFSILVSSNTVAQTTVAVVLESNSSELFLVEESSHWPLPRYAKPPQLDNIPPQFTIQQRRKINEVHLLVSVH